MDAVIKLAAGAASLEGVEAVIWMNLKAVIKSAASAASPTAWELHGSARTAAWQVGGGRPGHSHAILTEAMEEAALAAT